MGDRVITGPVQFNRPVADWYLWSETTSGAGCLEPPGLPASLFQAARLRGLGVLAPVLGVMLRGVLGLCSCRSS